MQLIVMEDGMRHRSRSVTSKGFAKTMSLVAESSEPPFHPARCWVHVNVRNNK